MKSTEFVRIFILFSIFSASSSTVFRPPEDSGTDQDQVSAPWHSDWAEVVGCEKGTTHSRFPDCFCGQYAKIVNDVLPQELENEGYYYKWRRGRKIYYVCLPCSSCPDGIVMTGRCRQTQDTSCDLDRCIDPDHVFDDGKKACVPSAMEPPQLLHKEFPKDLYSSVKEKSTERPDENDVSSTQANAAEPEDPAQGTVWHSNVLAIIVVSLVVVVAVNIILFVTVIHRKRRRYRTMTRVASNLSQSTQTGCTSCMHETHV